MIIGKIDYINLLPFYIFLKKRLSSQEKRALEYYKGVPRTVNRLFMKQKVEAAVISSILSKKYRCSDFGIAANKKVLSVIVCPGAEKEDSASNTSNVLKKVLSLSGEVLIGDAALVRQKRGDCIDLAQKWYEKTGFPFVFARFCYQKNAPLYKKLSQDFLRSHNKIPHYILKKYAKRSNLSYSDIKEYLDLIHYRLGIKEKRSLKKFLLLAKKYQAI